jgi:hypothetical protein
MHFIADENPLKTHHKLKKGKEIHALKKKVESTKENPIIPKKSPS